MKIYLASRYSLKPTLEKYAKELKKLGAICTSSWLNEPHNPDVKMAELDASMHTNYAETDIRDIFQADAMIFFSVDPLTPTARGGRHVEFGYALGLRMPIIVVGPRENIFHYLPGVTHCETWEEAKKCLVNLKV